MELNRLGEERVNLQGSIMKIIKYNNNKDIIVEFKDEYKHQVHTDYRWFKLGKVKNIFAPSVLNIGYLGESSIYDNNNKLKKSYDTWVHMIKRGYDKKYKTKNNTYKDCTVCDEWLCYSNFEKWYNKNYYEIEGTIIDLDKDILIKGNKLYSPNTCCFVPHCINSLFTKTNSKRGKYPIGVSFYEKYNKYIASCTIDSKSKALGYFDNIEDAFNSYKTTKESYIKQIATKYKKQISTNVYNALLNYKIEITD